MLLSCVAVTVLLTTGLAAVLWTFSAGAVPAGALGILANPQGRSIALSGLANAPGKAASDSQFIGATLRKAWPGVGFRMDSALWADPIQLPSPPRAGRARRPSQSSQFPGCSTQVSTQIQLASLEGISAEASLTAGRWPGPPRPGGPLPGGTAGCRGQPGWIPEPGSVLPAGPHPVRQGTGLAAGHRPVPGQEPGVAVLGTGPAAGLRGRRQRFRRSCGVLPRRVPTSPTAPPW